MTTPASAILPPRYPSNVALGHVIVLNGIPRSGKSTVASALLDRLDGSWVNIGVDTMQAATPDRLQPGMGLRPGGERRELEPFVVAAFAAMYAAVRSFAQAGVGVVVDVGHHDNYSQPLDILGRSARELTGVPVLFVGVRCSADVVVERRRATWGDESADEAFERVRRWEDAVHRPGIYDLEVDTAAMSAEGCADLIQRRWAEGPGAAFAEAAAVGQT
jgi:chloramphenicol 3-O phosphotransferase